MSRKRKSSPKSPKLGKGSKRSKKPVSIEEEDEEINEEEVEEDVLSDEELAESSSHPLATPTQMIKPEIKVVVKDDGDDDVVLEGEPIPDEEARKRWPHHYPYLDNKGKGEDVTGIKSSIEGGPDEVIQAVQHYTKAREGSVIYNLGDDALVQAEEGKDNYICKIVEIFKATNGLSYFRAQWYYRAKDTAIKSSSHLINIKRVFFSEITDDNPLGCLIGKLNIVRLPLEMEASEREAATVNSDFFCDMIYLIPYSSFTKLPTPIGKVEDESESDSTISNEVDIGKPVSINKPGMTLLDIYSGCGGMSTGLSLGANAAGANLVAKWAVDLNQYACESLSYNHPETNVRNESAEDYLALLKKWVELCDLYKGSENMHENVDSMEEDDDDSPDGANGDGGEVYEVEQILDIKYGDPNKIKKPGLYFKVKWKGYGPEFDTWEPYEGLCDCPDRLKEFVVNGYNSELLPLPGKVDVICGGPPCQGISGFNRFRDREDPFKDVKNKQLLVYMDIIEHLKPKFVLMENVVDLLKFSGGLLGRYALSRLISMNYQTRLGMMAAGAYGLPQFRMRVFLWGACPSEKLPQYPLPTHKCVYKGVLPTEFDSCYVKHSDEKAVELEGSLFLKDAISDLPAVGNLEDRDEMPYDGEPETEFQKFIRSPKDGASAHLLYDHRPYKVNKDDYQRVCQIPKRKGANFRDLTGVIVGEDKKVKFDPTIERIYLPSGKPLVPDYAMKFVKGKSKKPFGRRWWDETVGTVITRPQPHNHALLHPEQDRVLSVRENARLQGFPDHYKLFGPIKERYVQVGNAVAVPVSRALGYALGSTMQGIWSEDPLITLPKKFPYLESESPRIEKVDLS